VPTTFPQCLASPHPAGDSTECCFDWVPLRSSQALRLADQYIRESNGETVNPTNASPADTTNNNNSNSNNYPATPSGFPATPAAGGEPGDSKAGMAALLEGEGGKAGRGGQVRASSCVRACSRHRLSRPSTPHSALPTTIG
jgi:hypothetical protein